MSRYTPRLPPEQITPEFLYEELKRIAESSAYPDMITAKMTSLAVEPLRPREGLFAYADGTNWDPSHGQGLYVYEDSQWEPLFNTFGGVVTAQTQVVNTTTETTIFSHTVAANVLKAGEMFVLTLGGYYDTNTGSDTFTLRVKLGSTTLATITRQSNGNATDFGWELSVRATCRSAGVSGQVIDYTKLVEDTYSAIAADATVHTIDTTSSHTVTVTVQWGSASANNDFRIEQGIVEFKH